MASWNVVEPISKKLQGYVWKVRRERRESVQTGYFKFATPDQRYYAGPMVANEMIADALARHLGLPVAELEYAEIEGHRGVVSIARDADHVAMWRDLPSTHRRNIKGHFNNAAGLLGMVVFDVWTTNIDRASGKNLIVYRNRGMKKLDWYLIDHALALHGSYWKWDLRGHWKSPVWERVSDVYKLPDGLTRQIRSLRQLDPWIRRCRRISDHTLHQIVGAIPRSHLTPEEADQILGLLIWRRGRLRSILGRWLRSKRKVKSRPKKKSSAATKPRRPRRRKTRARKGRRRR